MNTFSLLCWNVQKKSLDPEFLGHFEALLLHHPADIVALQEAKIAEGGRLPAPLGGYHVATSCNIRLPRWRFGVMTLSRLPMSAGHRYLSTTREAGFATRKSALLTRHTVGGRTVTLLNLHAINFVPHRLFVRELERIAHFLGPLQSERLVVAGDFNTWSRKRQSHLEEVMALFGLVRVRLQNAQRIKAVLGKPLDHVYCRGLEATKAQVVETPVSDHNPIWVEFSLGREEES